MAATKTRETAPVRKCSSCGVATPAPFARSSHRRTSAGSASATKGALNDVVVLDVAQDAWFRPRAARVGAPPPRAFHCACATGDGRCVVVTCGRDGRAQRGDAED